MTEWLLSWEFLGASGYDWLALAFIYFLIGVAAFFAYITDPNR